MEEWLVAGAVVVAAAVLSAPSLFLFRNTWKSRQGDAMLGMVTTLSQELQTAIDENRNLRERMVAIEDEFALWKDGMRQLLGQLRDLDIEPVWTPPDHPVRTMDRPTLGQFIADHYSPGELDVLATRVDIKGENLEGETHDARAHALVKAAVRHRRITRLRDQVRKDRPDTYKD